MTKNCIIKIILPTAILVGLFACKSTKPTTEAAGKAKTDKQNTTVQIAVKDEKSGPTGLKGSVDSVKQYSDKECASCKNLMDSIRMGYVKDMGIIGGIPYYLKKEENVPPIMIKVFPDVVFTYLTSPFSNLKHSGYVILNDGNHDLKWEFNKVYKLMRHTTEITFKDRVQAAIQVLVGYENEMSIVSIQNTETKLDNYTYNYKVIAKVNNTDNEVLLLVKNDEFKLVSNITTNKGFITPMPVENF